MRTDTERLDWLDKQREERHAHWGGGDGPTVWVDPRIVWRISYMIKDGTYQFPDRLKKVPIRKVIDQIMDEEMLDPPSKRR